MPVDYLEDRSKSANKMLLKVKAETNNGETYLDVWTVGGKHLKLRQPFAPFFYSKYPLETGICEAEKKTALSDLTEKTFWKMSYPCVEMERRNRPSDAIETLPYEQKVAIMKGLFASSPFPSLDAFDLEMKTRKGLFPNPQIDPILAIGYSSDDSEKCKTLHENPEYELIAWFVEQVQKRNPDIIADYWGSFADWDWLIQRAEINNVDLAVGRDGSKPWISIREFWTGKRTGEDRKVHVAGRIHFDVWKEAYMDTDLYGIKNKQLKTVAEWFGLPTIREDYSKLNVLLTEKLQRYCLSDARLARVLALMYLKNLVPLGDLLKIPFNMTVDRHPSHPPRYVYGRTFAQHNIISDGYNKERFPAFGKKGYQGALVTLFKSGVFYDLKHADFKSMYPNIMVCYNYSPETILWTQISPANNMKEWVKISDDKISVKDEKHGIITCKMDLSHDSMSRTVLSDLMKWRKDLKAEMENAEKQGLDTSDLSSRQWGIKVIMNTLTGYHGLGYARYGCYPIIAHICAHGRWQIDIATNNIETQGGYPIERDTDGIYYIGDISVKDIEENIKNGIPDIYEKDAIEIATKEYDAGIFYDEKGYVLKKGDKLTFHGGGLKGKQLPNCCDKALEIIVKAVFAEENIVRVLNEIGSELKGLSIEDFLMTAQLRKRPGEYDKKTLYGKLVSRAKTAGIPFRWGDELQYVKTASYGFLPFSVYSDYKINYNYYRDRIADVAERILRVTHDFSKKTILNYLGGYRTL